MAGKFDLEIDQGSHFSITFTREDSMGAPYDLTGWTAKMQIRASRWDDEDTPLVTLTDTDGITLGSTAGTVTVDISAARTADLISGECVYDILLTDTGGKIFRLIEGKAVVNPRVTR